MTQIPTSDFADSVNDSLVNNWTRIAGLLMDRPCLLAGHDLNSFKSNPDILRRAISDCYDMSPEKADAVLRNIVQEADSFPNTAAMRRVMAQFWTEMTDHDFDMIAGRRAELVCVLQIRYQLSRDAAWAQVHRFFARHKP